MAIDHQEFEGVISCIEDFFAQSSDHRRNFSSDTVVSMLGAATACAASVCGNTEFDH